MSVFHENMLIGASGQGAVGPTAGRSIRLNSADSARLTRSFSSSDRRTWTLSCWVKRCKFDASNPTFTIFSRVNGAAYVNIGFANDYLKFADYDGANDIVIRYTQAFYRDPASWYHIVVVLDTTNATQDDRARLYVNGSRITAFASANSITLNAQGQANSSGTHEIGRDTVDNVYSDGYLALVHFISGQALTPSSFGETSATTGQWIAKTYSGTYGTNGFFLDFLDNSTAAALGYDAAGSNDWTVNNLSVTAGSGNDSLRDHPTSAGTSTGVGGEVAGNYCTFNPLDRTTNAGTLTNGNLDLAQVLSGGGGSIRGTIGVSSGKWYFEVTPTTAAAGTDIGVVTVDSTLPANFLGTSATAYTYYQDGDKANNNTRTSYGTSWTTNDVIGVALDLDNGKIFFAKNNTWQNSGSPTAGTNPAFSGLSGTFTVGVGDGNSFNGSTFVLNCGQRAFAYTAPSGFSPLVDTLLPTPTIAKPNTVMDALLWTGNGSARSITGLGFNPDLVWIKGRSGATDHALYDVVRGAEKRLESNNTDAEVTSDGGVTAFNSDGFSLGTLAQVNTNSATYVGWAWDAGSSNATNTSGTITSTVRANISAGFSVISFAATGSNGTVGHGLGVAPAFIIGKNRSSASLWRVYHSSIAATKVLFLNSTDGETTDIAFNSTAPTSSVISVNGSEVLNNSGNIILYAWTPVAGLSSFGSYVGNGSSDGPFVYTGFRPRWVLIKMSSSTGSWYLIDTARLGYNPDNNPLYPNLTADEQTDDIADILSNGFKIRNSFAGVNTSSGTYVWAAFAEAPFPYARAR